MDDGIVHTSSAKLVFDNAEGALAYYNAYASDFGISDMQLDVCKQASAPWDNWNRTHGNHN